MQFSRHTTKLYRQLQLGSAAIEFALLLPWLILMIDGVAEFGVLIYNQSVLVSATGMAARAGMAAGSTKLSALAISQLAQDYCVANLKLIAKDSVPSSQVVQAAEPVFQLPLQVSVQYTYQGLLIGGVLSALQMQPVMHATSVMYNE